MKLYQINSNSWITNTGIMIDIYPYYEEVSKFMVFINNKYYSNNKIDTASFNTREEALEEVKSFFKIED